MSTIKQPSIDASADDWLFYADQLQHQGDARGELIVLNHAVAGGSPPDARDQFVKANAESLLGPAGSKVDALRLGWRWMWIDTAEIVAKSDADAITAAALLDSSASAEITALTIAGDARTENDKINLEPAISAVVARGLPTKCRSFR